MLIPVITERKCYQLDRNILALPVRFGGLGLRNPSLETRRELDCKTVVSFFFFFFKISKEIGKARRKMSYAGEGREAHEPVGHVRREKKNLSFQPRSRPFV